MRQRLKTSPGRRASGRAVVEDIEIRKADLEDVFLDVMAKASESPSQASDAAAGVVMSGWQTLYYSVAVLEGGP